MSAVTSLLRLSRCNRTLVATRSAWRACLERCLCTAHAQHQRQMTAAVAGGSAAPSEAAACAAGPALSLPTFPTLLDKTVLPVPEHVRGAWVEHVLAPREDYVSVLVSEALGLPRDFVLELLRFGAVHSCPVPPTLPDAISSSKPAHEVAAQRQVKAAAEKRHGRGSHMRTPQRLAGDAVVTEHAYIRVHLVPKRFRQVYAVDWRERIIADAADYLVVNKPHSVPAVPTVDNWLECVLTCAAAAVGHPSPLYTTSRLDQCTEGVLVLGKTKEFVQLFNILIKTEGATRKFYRALTATPPPPGTLVHHLQVATRRPLAPHFSIAHDKPVEGSLPCELRVMDVQPVELTGAAREAWGPSAYECSIELITGRTHQIRAQLSAVGCPLMGDALYQPLASAQLRQELYRADPTSPLVDSHGQRLLQEPEGGIGLQACRLEVESDRLTGSSPAVFEAGTPWWRS